MAESKLSTAQRNKIEQIIYDTYDAVDPTHTNSDYYKEIFSKMNNDQFYKFLQRRLPFRMHISTFKLEPSMNQIFKAFDVLGKPLIEKVNLNYKYKNKDGVAINSKECLVGYINIKRMKQFLTKKNSLAIEIAQRDMKTGLLMNEDKGGKTSDREFESLAASDLNFAMDEFSGIRADAMRAKNEAYNIITTNGVLHADDIDIDKDDSISKNLLSAMLIGANIYSNVVNEDYYTPLTLKNRQAKNVERK